MFPPIDASQLTALEILVEAVIFVAKIMGLGLLMIAFAVLLALGICHDGEGW